MRSKTALYVLTGLLLGSVLLSFQRSGDIFFLSRLFSYTVCTCLKPTCYWQRNWNQFAEQLKKKVRALTLNILLSVSVFLSFSQSPTPHPFFHSLFLSLDSCFVALRDEVTVPRALSILIQFIFKYILQTSLNDWRVSSEQKISRYFGLVLHSNDIINIFTSNFYVFHKQTNWVMTAHYFRKFAAWSACFNVSRIQLTHIDSMKACIWH